MLIEEEGCRKAYEDASTWAEEGHIPPQLRHGTLALPRPHVPYSPEARMDDQSCLLAHSLKLVMGQSMPACGCTLVLSHRLVLHKSVVAHLADILGRQYVHATVVTRVAAVREHVHDLDARVSLPRHFNHLFGRDLPVRHGFAGNFAPRLDPFGPAADVARGHVVLAGRHLVDGVCEVTHVAHGVQVGDRPMRCRGKGHLYASVGLLPGGSEQVTHGRTGGLTLPR